MFTFYLTSMAMENPRENFIAVYIYDAASNRTTG